MFLSVKSEKTVPNNFLHTGKSHGDNIYCKVILGDQEQHTDIGKDNLINGNTPQNGAPQVPMLVWNYSMQFLIRNINEDALTITVFEMCPFQPDGTFNTTCDLTLHYSDFCVCRVFGTSGSKSVGHLSRDAKHQGADHEEAHIAPGGVRRANNKTRHAAFLEQLLGISIVTRSEPQLPKLFRTTAKNTRVSIMYLTVFE